MASKRIYCHPRQGVFQLWPWSVLVLVFLLFGVLRPLPAVAVVSSGGGKEAVIRKAGELINEDEHNRANMREAISLLEAERPGSGEIRIPLLLAEAYYRLADPEDEIDRTFPIYEKAGGYARAALERDPARAEGHYWYGLFLLKKAQKVGGIRAYFITRDGIRELENVRQAMPDYDHGGASRVLGLLYYIAPGWSPFGDIEKSIQLGEETIRIAPHYLLNRLYLARAYQKKGDKTAAVREYRKIATASLNLPGQKVEALYQVEARKMLMALGQADTQANAVLRD